MDKSYKIKKFSKLYLNFSPIVDQNHKNLPFYLIYLDQTTPKLLSKGRGTLNALIGVLTSYCRLKRHLSLGVDEDPTCPRCGRDEKPSFHFLGYLVRLPKTTPEGYKVLLYAVRDNDPTKMNFAECVKGFCMYNDCILSEDGLAEGYVVLFDMKGVQIGHLARVSLPALRCFMMYIQEGHPCRLKGIHILNTASWIHHIMRIIVPLVKSDLLNLVKFHKGSIPEGLPQEILPMDLGGDAPSIEDLDRDTKSLLDKYHEWLIETGHFISDESKRVKKASWWGFFNGSNKTNNAELDEKAILKNLQID